MSLMKRKRETGYQRVISPYLYEQNMEQKGFEQAQSGLMSYGN